MFVKFHVEPVDRLIVVKPFIFHFIELSIKYVAHYRNFNPITTSNINNIYNSFMAHKKALIC